MAIVAANTYDNGTGIREELADVISNISPEDTPFVSNAPKVSVDNTYFEWLTDSLAAVSAATEVEGADATFATPTDVTRLGNYTEIIEKTAQVSGTVEATDRAGKDREMAYQMVKRGKEIMRDMEHHAVGIHQAQVAGNASTPTARKTGSFVSYVATNAVLGTAGSPAAATGDGTDVPTVGTARAFTEALLGEVIDGCWAEGGDPEIIMCNSFQKRAMNSFAGNTQSGGTAGNIRQTSDAKKIINATSVYESDYGMMNIVPNRFCKTTDVLVYEREHFQIAELRPMTSHEIAKTGDSEKRQLVCEWGLKVTNEKSSGAVLACTTS